MVQSRSASNPAVVIRQAVTFGNLRLETDGRLTRGNDVIHLPPRELAALEVLISDAGKIVTHRQLKEILWGDVHVTDDSVTKCLSSLRELLAPDDCIQTVYKRGYRLSVEVHRGELGAPETGPRLVITPLSTELNVPVYLGSAVAEETIALLTADRFSPVRVLARDSAFSLSARGMTAHQVGEALHADFVLTGTIRALPSHFRLRAEMIRVSDGTQIWVEDMMVPQGRRAGLESELANRLYVRLGSCDSYLSRPQTAEPSVPANPQHYEAYELFLRGHQEWQSLQRHRMQDGIQHLMRAAELDPEFYAPQIDLANATVVQMISGFVAPIEAAKQVRRIVESIPSAAEGAEAVLPALGWIRFHVDHDLYGAIRAFSSSAHLPHETSTTRHRSLFAMSRHHFKDAIELLRGALQEDPFSPWLNARLAWAYHLCGEKEKSVAQAEHALDIFPSHESSNIYGAIILAFNGQLDRAIAIGEVMARQFPYFDPATAVYGYVLARAGRIEEARAILERLQWLSRERFVLSSFTAPICVALEDMEGAIAELQAASESRCPWFFQMLADPRFEPLRSHPKFVNWQTMLERMESSAEKKLAQER